MTREIPLCLPSKGHAARCGRMTLASRFTLSGQVRAVATVDPSGPLTVTGYGANSLVTVITRVELSGKVAWQRAYPGTGGPQSRLSTDGTLWVAYPDGDGRLLEGVLPDGSTGPTARPECRPDEEIGAFVLLDDGFVVSWVSASRLVRGDRSRATSLPQPRVARYTQEGGCLWSTSIALGAVSFPGMVEMGDRTGRELRPRRPWAPEETGVDHWEPLLVSADRIAAGFTGTRGGIGRTFLPRPGQRRDRLGHLSRSCGTKGDSGTWPVPDRIPGLRRVHDRPLRPRWRRNRALGQPRGHSRRRERQPRARKLPAVEITLPAARTGQHPRGRVGADGLLHVPPRDGPRGNRGVLARGASCSPWTRTSPGTNCSPWTTTEPSSVARYC